MFRPGVSKSKKVLAKMLKTRSLISPNTVPSKTGASKGCTVPAAANTLVFSKITITSRSGESCYREMLILREDWCLINVHVPLIPAGPAGVDAVGDVAAVDAVVIVVGVVVVVAVVVGAVVATVVVAVVCVAVVAVVVTSGADVLAGVGVVFEEAVVASAVVVSAAVAAAAVV